MERPKSTWHPSPNFTPRDPGREIVCVVIHATRTDSKESALRTLCDPRPDDPKKRVSAHWLIDALGMIYGLVDEQNDAWHVGYSSWNGRTHINTCSIGIELVKDDKNEKPYPPEQLTACADLVASICKDRKITMQDVVGHCDVADGRTPEEKAQHLKDHDDPCFFPWGEFWNMLRERGVEEI